MRSLALFGLMALVAAAGFAQNAAGLVPKSVIVRFALFEIPADYRIAFQAGAAKRANGKTTAMLQDARLLEKLSKLNGKGGVKQCSAPVVRTLDGFAASVAQHISGSLSAPPRMLKFTATPHVGPDGQIQLDAAAKLWIGEEGKEGFQLLWSFAEPFAVKGNGVILVDVVHTDEGAARRMPLFVGAELIEDRP